MNLIQTLNKEQADKLSAGKNIPDFEPGDTVIVNVKVVEGERTRIQAYEGVCIGRSGRGINESFTVRKISYGEGVERVFPLCRRWSTRSSSCAAARCAAPSSITCAVCAASRRASPRARITAARPRTWRTPPSKSIAGTGRQCISGRADAGASRRHSRRQRT